MLLQRLLQELHDSGQLDLRNPTVQQDALVKELRRILRNESLRLIASKYEPEVLLGLAARRLAKRLKKRTLATSSAAEKPWRKAYGGGVPKPNLKAGRSQHRLTAMMNNASTVKSGSSVYRFQSPRLLKRIKTEGQLADSSASVTFTETQQSVQSTITLQLANEEFFNTVLGGAYAGDLSDLTISNVHYVWSTIPTFINSAVGAVPIAAKANATATVVLPQVFQTAGAPAELLLHGTFDLLAYEAGLRTLPPFALTLGAYTISDCFLAIATAAPEDIPDAFASLNGTLDLFGAKLPMSSDLPPPDGLLSFNLETSAAPLLTDLAALDAITGDSVPREAWGPNGTKFLGMVKQYRLEKLNLLYDLATPGLVSVSFQVLCGNWIEFWYDSPRLVVRIESLRLSWLYGNPLATPAITTGGTGIGRVAGFDSVTWEVWVDVYPDLCVRLWAPAEQLPWSTLASYVGSQSRQMPVVTNYSGCVLKCFPDRFELYVGDDWGDFPRAI